MRYCRKCGRLSQEERCCVCGKKMREIAEDEPVMLAAMDSFKASMLEPLLKDAGIPCYRMGKVGASVAISSGLNLEEIRVFVPFGAYERALELWEMLSTPETVQ